MAATLEELERRLTRVEQELARWLQGSGTSPVERGAWLWHNTSLQQAQVNAGLTAVFEQMGIGGEPVGAEKVQEMMAACGVKPEDNEFSRAIIDLREE